MSSRAAGRSLMTRAVTQPGGRRLPARLIDMEADEGPYGPRYTWWLEAEDVHGLAKLRTWTSRDRHPRSRASSYIAAFLGRPLGPREAVDLAALIGRACTLEVATNENGFLVVKAVLPAATAVRS